MLERNKDIELISGVYSTSSPIVVKSLNNEINVKVRY